MTDDLGREPIPGVAGASGYPHPTRLLTPIGSRKRSKPRQVDGALVQPVVTYFALTYDLGFSIPMLIGGGSWCLALYLGPETKGKEMVPDLVLA